MNNAFFLFRSLSLCESSLLCALDKGVILVNLNCNDRAVSTEILKSFEVLHFQFSVFLKMTNPKKVCRDIEIFFSSRIGYFGDKSRTGRFLFTNNFLAYTRGDPKETEI